MYYFLSQTDNFMGNDPVMTKIFVSTLLGTAFIWFMQLPLGLSKHDRCRKRVWVDFFEDDAKVSVQSHCN